MCVLIQLCVQVWCTRSQRCPVLTQGLISRVGQPLSTHSHCVTYQRMPPPHRPSSTDSLIQQPNPILAHTHTRQRHTGDPTPATPTSHTSPVPQHYPLLYPPPATRPAPGLEWTLPDSTAAAQSAIQNTIWTTRLLSLKRSSHFIRLQNVLIRRSSSKCSLLQLFMKIYGSKRSVA